MYFCLSLQWNKIDDTGAQYLAKALTRNKTLKAIYLLGNDISADAAREIIECSLTYDDTPIQLDISYSAPRPRDKRPTMMSQVKGEEDSRPNTPSVAVNSTTNNNPDDKS